MADKTVQGGKNVVDFFRVNDTGSAYELKKLNGTDAATQASHAALRIVSTVELKPAIKAPIATPSWDQDKDDPDFKAFLDVTAHKASTSGGNTITERVYEDNTKKFGAAGSNPELVVAVHYGGLLSDATKRKVFSNLGTIDPESGDWTQNAKDNSKPQLKMTGVAAKYDLVLDAVLDATIVSSGAITIKEGLSFDVSFQTPA